MANDSTPAFYQTAIQRLLSDIQFHQTPFPPHDAEFWNRFHDWMLNTLGPTSSWSAAQLAELEHASGGIIERAYPQSSTPMKLHYAQLTAIAILIDDSIEDAEVNAAISAFSLRLYRGEPQTHALLQLYRDELCALSERFGRDTVLRGMATLPWITYIDGCLLEKEIFEAKAQDASMDSTEGFGVNFPHYLRTKSGISEAYAAAIFKAFEEQFLPHEKFIKAIPDMVFWIQSINDLLSFHKEQLAGETYNLIHLSTQEEAASGAVGSNGPWSCEDTFNKLCDETRAATRRIDGLLINARADDASDAAIQAQWRGFRDGYISWHFECRRYRLGAMKRAIIDDSEMFLCTSSSI